MKEFYTLGLAMGLASISLAQSPLNLADLEFTLGSQFELAVSEPVDPGMAGLDQTWTFVELTPQNVLDVEIATPEALDVEEIFPLANYAFSLNDAVAAEGYFVDENSYQFYGQYEPGFELIYEDPNTFIQFPIEMDGSFVDTYASNYNLGGTTGSIKGTNTSVVDGYGTLVMSWGTIEGAYRVESEIEQTEYFSIEGEDYVATYTATNYSYFAPGFPIPVAFVSNGIIEIPALNIVQNQNFTRYIREYELVGTKDVDVFADVSVFPNPATDMVQVKFTNLTPNEAEVRVLNTAGKVVKSVGSFNVGVGPQTTQFDISDLAAGYYLLELRNEAGVYGTKLVKTR